ncbi:elongation factor P maturation arginine rhamnosyltransferase EarP [Denitromonas ohlonensis]|uniref:Protein-arginine rhamnosyltransferase n=2 Tax=Denitromonas TaxID=139331 RepID=A0A557RQI7_9RHOO|nr:elongation factor P maturation arginine rhamnosyltransferase EarP [Denitromonas ohlonensis]TVO67413.1 elongation factor P maturation arginine rhamnosyltransferase EarP [Denitromonas ohlonensis]TVO72032.1 elongation factor P maturation arginine rhamnosyltransferase EarP [Denitromonas ohlonensis]
MQWDIYCRVVDNFGDIGVSWRLARALAQRSPHAVRLFVDDWATLRRLLPRAPAVPAPFVDSKVSVQPWAVAEVPTTLADCVIEAFGCALPPIYLAAMRDAQTPPVWINLEYLSAEDWIEDCHGLPSPDPATGLAKTFFFPGFTARSGGLIREPDVFSRRDAAQAETGRHQWLAAHGGADVSASAQWISLFSYDNPRLVPRLTDWQVSETPVVLWVPEGTAWRGLMPWLGESHAAQTCWQRGALTVCALPFLSMADYDRLLAMCDVNFVRGEDSFVRAQWAARPFVWQAYPQADAAHVDKMDAFLGRYLTTADTESAAAFEAMWRDWNGLGAQEQAWQRFSAALPTLRQHARQWCDQIAATDGLVERLVKMVQPDVK